MRKTVLKFTYKSNLQKTYTENLGTIDDTDIYSTDEAKRNAVIDTINTGCRAIASLTTNIYDDAQIITEYSVNEEIADRG